MSMLIIGSAIAGLALAVVMMGVKVVPQGYCWTVERFGRYTQTLKPGLSFIIPVIEGIGRKISIMESVMQIDPQECISADNVMVKIDAVCFFQVELPERAAYSVDNLQVAIRNLVMTNIRSALGSMELDQILSSRETINSQLMSSIKPAVESWGVRMLRVEIADVTPPVDLVEAMASQMKAERVKRAHILEAEGRSRAEVLTAEGEKASAILRAEGEKQAACLQAEARERAAEAEAKATEVVSKAISDGDINAVNYFVAQRYIDALGKVATSDNSKLIMMPLEATQVTGAIAGISELLKAGKA